MLIHLNPSYELQFEAEQAANKFSQSNRWNNILSEDHIIQWYIHKGILESDYQKTLDTMSSQKQRQLVEYYHVALSQDETKLDTLRRRLVSLSNEISNIEAVLIQLRQKTREGLSERFTEEYILSRSIYSGRKRKIKFPAKEIDKIIYHINFTYPTVQQIREAARSNKAQTLWNTQKSKMFPKVPNDLQIIFMNYLQLYRNVNKSPDSPPDFIIEDDFALDGWLIEQSKGKNEKKISDKVASREHVFVTAKNQEEANEIYASNKGAAKALQQMRMSKLKTGAIKESEFKKKTRLIK